jgi:hypothetical protein
MITNIDIDESLIAEAMQVCGARSKREAVDRALREMVARARRPRFSEHFGIGGIDPEYDPKAPGATAGEAGRNRVEEPRAPYRTAPAPAPKSAAKKPVRKR